MAGFGNPSWEQLDELVASANRSLTVCAPFVTKPGLDRVGAHLRDGVVVEVITRISVDAWVAAVCDPEALLEFLIRFGAGSVKVSNRLHAKAIIADGERALVGSANLTWRAYSHNLELQAELVPGETGEVLAILAAWNDSVREFPVAELGEWISRHRPAILAERQRQDEESPTTGDALGAAQESLDELAGGRAIDQRPFRPLEESLLEDFVDWVDGHQGLAGALEIVQRHENIGGSNLTGHVKQSFFASYLFFLLEPEWIEPASQLLTGLAAGDIPQPEGALLEAWMDHVVANAGLISDVYSFPVLRGILPPGLGGTRLGGGGGSSTLKRVLPLVARWIEGSE